MILEALVYRIPDARMAPPADFLGRVEEYSGSCQA